MLATEIALVDAARACLGTPFRHQGRSATRGLDCVGLIVVAARAAGFSVIDCAHYGRSPQPEDFMRYIRANSLERLLGPRPGAVALFDMGAGPQHAGLLTQNGLIHAYAPSRRVVEHGFRAPWPTRVHAYFAFPENG